VERSFEGFPQGFQISQTLAHNPNADSDNLDPGTLPPVENRIIQQAELPSKNQKIERRKLSPAVKRGAIHLTQ
jgi:hypothetical protein